MRGLCRLLVPLLGLAAPVTPGIAVREVLGRIDVTAAAASLADVLDRLARQTGMKIVYEGPAPRQLVTLSLVARSPAEAVTAILEGQGLNYALVLDRTATRVEKLLVTGTASTAAGQGPRHVPLSTIQPRYIPSDPDPEPDEALEEPPPTPDAPLPTTETLPVVTPVANPAPLNGPFPPGVPPVAGLNPPGAGPNPPAVPTPLSPLNPGPAGPLVPVISPQPTPTPPVAPP
jgi:hypothetical protein